MIHSGPHRPLAEVPDYDELVLTFGETLGRMLDELRRAVDFHQMWVESFATQLDRLNAKASE